MVHLTIIDHLEKIIKRVVLSNLSFVYSANIEKSKFKINIEKIKNASLGDYTTKFLLSLKLPASSVETYVKYFKKKLLLKKNVFKSIEYVAPGFLNIKLNDGFLNKYIENAYSSGKKYGSLSKKSTFYNIEFVSANPTGYMHLGHARNAAYGDTLANIFTKCGISVNREFFINDGGNQINNLAQAVYIRYLQLNNISIELPEDSYHGQEIITIAKKILEMNGDKFVKNHRLSDSELQYFKTTSTNYMIDEIKTTLKDFGVVFDIWFRESNIYKDNLISHVLKQLKPYLYKSEGATFLRTTDFGDDKDRVLIKSDGSYTYFTPDIAYHQIKLLRGYDKIFDILGADHASYVKRLAISIEMLGSPQDKLQVLIQQMVKLTKNGEEFKMSKRSGNSLTIIDLIKTIGRDAARWFLVSTSLDSHLEIDVDKVKSNDTNNPIYYVQYAHARINQIILKNNKLKLTNKYDLLNLDIEREIKLHILYYKNTLIQISKKYDVHSLCNYLVYLARLFHSYYASNRVIDENKNKLSSQRLAFVKLIKNVLADGLTILGIEPTDKMQ
ncbi:MAG: arginine--tRNA ligase [Mycoplasmataceae bacterium]|nr:arginine--tRNA ligase [Mycoplasmataceae bacterium]